MSLPPNLLNDDGTASIATLLMMSHHGFRRDLRRFLVALDQPALTAARSDALRDEWRSFRATLHAHHEAEDEGVFPSLHAQGGTVATVTDGLSADHRLIEPLLGRGDRAFEELTSSKTDALAVVSELKALLEPHLATEEAAVLPLLRAAKAFPPPPTDAAADFFAQGFAWCMHGVAPDVLESVYAMLPESLLSRLPAARSAFEARYERVWASFRSAQRARQFRTREACAQLLQSKLRPRIHQSFAGEAKAPS